MFSFTQPRLGPKPFSSNSGDVSFDKVFAVPVAPGSQENIHHASTVGSADNGGDSFVAPAPAAPVVAATTQNKPDLIVEIEIKSEWKNFYFLFFTNFFYYYFSTEPNADNAGDSSVQKSLSTSERRKVCQKLLKSNKIIAKSSIYCLRLINQIEINV